MRSMRTSATLGFVGAWDLGTLFVHNTIVIVTTDRAAVNSQEKHRHIHTYIGRRGQRQGGWCIQWLIDQSKSVVLLGKSYADAEVTLHGGLDGKLFYGTRLRTRYLIMYLIRKRKYTHSLCH